MTQEDLIAAYLTTRGELAAAFAAPTWNSTRPEHIARVSGELAPIEAALEDAGIDDALFADLLSGRLS